MHKKIQTLTGRYLEYKRRGEVLRYLQALGSHFAGSLLRQQRDGQGSDGSSDDSEAEHDIKRGSGEKSTDSDSNNNKKKASTETLMNFGHYTFNPSSTDVQKQICFTSNLIWIPEVQYRHIGQTFERYLPPS